MPEGGLQEKVFGPLKGNAKIREGFHIPQTVSGRMQEGTNTSQLSRALSCPVKNVADTDGGERPPMLPSDILGGLPNYNFKGEPLCL